MQQAQAHGYNSASAWLQYRLYLSIPAIQWKGSREAEHYMHSPAYTSARLCHHQQAKANRARRQVRTTTVGYTGVRNQIHRKTNCRAPFSRAWAWSTHGAQAAAGRGRSTHSSLWLAAFPVHVLHPRYSGRCIQAEPHQRNHCVAISALQWNRLSAGILHGSPPGDKHVSIAARLATPVLEPKGIPFITC